MSIKTGDVIKLFNGRMLIVKEKSDLLEAGLHFVEYMDGGNGYLELKKEILDINFGQDPVIVFNFHAIRSLHLRLNNLGKV